MTSRARRSRPVTSWSRKPTTVSRPNCKCTQTIMPHAFRSILHAFINLLTFYLLTYTKSSRFAGQFAFLAVNMTRYLVTAERRPHYSARLPISLSVCLFVRPNIWYRNFSNCSMAVACGSGSVFTGVHAVPLGLLLQCQSDSTEPSSFNFTARSRMNTLLPSILHHGCFVLICTAFALLSIIRIAGPIMLRRLILCF